MDVQRSSTWNVFEYGTVLGVYWDEFRCAQKSAAAVLCVRWDVFCCAQNSAAAVC